MFIDYYEFIKWFSDISFYRLPTPGFIITMSYGKFMFAFILKMFNFCSDSKI